MQSNWIRWLVAGLAFAALAGEAQSQGQLPFSDQRERATPGATFGVVVPTDGMRGGFPRRHRSANGTICLKIGGVARPVVTNENLYNHWITAVNGCSNSIAIQVCYYGTRKCISMDVPGHGQREAILGILPSIKDFRYEYTERF